MPAPAWAVEAPKGLLCGVCALSAQIQEVREAGLPLDYPVFLPVGAKTGSLFAAFRRHCKALGLTPAWHAFRRGAAGDMLASGSPLGTILRAGSWRSGAFLRYLQRADVDERAVFESAVAGSASEDEE